MRPYIQFVPALFLVILASGVQAFIAPDGPELPNYDVRAVQSPESIAVARRTVVASLRSRVPDARVDFDEHIGTPKWVMSTHGFLSGVQGRGRGIGPAAAASVGPGEDHRATRGFLREHQELFGFGPETLDRNRVSQDSVTRHNGLRTVVWQQELDGIPIFDGLFISHTTRDEELVSVSSQFIPRPEQAAAAGTPNRAALIQAPPIPAARAVALAVQNLEEQLDEVDVTPVEVEAEGAQLRRHFRAPPLNGDADTKLVWLPMSQESLRLCWEVVLTSRARAEMYRVLIDAVSGEARLRHRLTEYLSNASYRVFTGDSPSPFSPGCPMPCTTQPPIVSRALVTLSALDTNASPAGWINDGGNQTLGNNVDAHTDRDGNNSADLPRPQGSPFRTFDFSLDLAQAPLTYTNAAVTDLFYWCNWMHDRLYDLGFTEAGRNFQTDNFGRGGLGNDALQADAQDGSGSNNANMSTPSDGSPPRMQMFLFTGPTPDRDGDFDHEVVLHEYTHGLSNRRVGGGAGLSALQSRGMGEGWSDWYALALLSEPGDDVHGVYAKGAYVTYLLSGMTQNYYFGIRRYPYSTDLTKNPLTFRDIDPQQASTHPGIPRSTLGGSTADEVHNQGEVWCVALWEARANLIAKYGYNVGNDLILRLVTDGMNLSPSNPNFLQARDAILQADVIYNGGADLPEFWAAFAKRGMGYSASSPSSSTTIGVVEAFDVPDDLLVLPEMAFVTAGEFGGPFVPSEQVYSLTNIGASNLAWTVTKTGDWFDISIGGGILAPGGPAAQVTVSLNLLVNSLPFGTHTGIVTFSNATSRVVQTRQVMASVASFAAMPFVETFESGAFAPYWTVSGNGPYRSQVVTANTPNGGSYHLTMDSSTSSSYARNEVTLGINLEGYTNVVLTFWAKEFSDEPHGPPPTPFMGGADFDGVAISQDGIFWYEVWGLRTLTSVYANQTVALDPFVAAYGLAYNRSFRIRFNQYDNFSITTDGIAVDDIAITGTLALPRISVSLPSLATEGDGTLAGQGSVALSRVPTNDVVVFLTSSETNEVRVPTTVTVPTGQTNATFDLMIVDDAELDGGRTAQVGATAIGHIGGSGVITVLDNETATLSLNVPPGVIEGQGTALGTVFGSAAPTVNIAVGLVSSDTTEIQVPASVILPAGQTSAVFNLTVINDTQIDGTQMVTISASVTNWTGSSIDLAVYDNEPTNLTVVLPASVREGDGTLTNAGVVSIGGTLPGDLTVALASSDLTELTLPPSTTIPGGFTSGTFSIVVADDPDVDSSQIVMVTASAPGFSDGTRNLTVTDDESPPEPFGPAPLHMATNVIQTTDLSWQSGALPGEMITNEVYFGTNPTPGPAELQGATTSSAWNLPTLAPLTTYYWQIIARKTGVTPGPIWQFTTRGVDHFVWDVIPSPQYVNEEFPVSVTAKDAFNTTVSNYTGTISLSASVAGGMATNKIIGDVVHSRTSSGTYTLAFAFTPNTNLTVTHVRSYSGTKVSLWTDSGMLLAAQAVSGPQGTWTETPLPAPLTLSAGLTYRVGYYTGPSGTYYYREDRPTTFPNGTIVNGYYYITGDAFPSTFYSADSTYFLCDLKYTVGAGGTLPVIPEVSGPFMNGAWTGNMTAQAPTTNVVLRADDGSEHVGDSNPFAVDLRNDIGVEVTDTPDPVSVGADITYTIAVTNIGPDNANGVVVTNLLPAGAALVSVTSSQGTVSTSGNLIVCNLHTLQSNSDASVVIIATATSIGVLTNQTFIARTGVDAYLANNSAVLTTSVQAPTMRISDVTLYEGNSGTVNAAFAVTITPAPALSAAVNFATVDGTAINPTDYTSTNGVLTFAPGETNKFVVVAVNGDGVYELNETFTVSLSAATNVALADSVGLGTILNDDPLPTLSIGDVVMLEGNTGSTNAVFTVGLSAPSSMNVSFSFSTANGSAFSGSDYVAKSGSLTILAGDQTTNIVVNVNSDLVVESDEVFYVDLTSAGNALLLKREGYCLLLNDDGLPGEADRFTWSAIPSPQAVGQPFGVTISAWDALGAPAVNFEGPAGLSVGYPPGATNLVGSGSSTLSVPMYTAYHDVRTQVIYPASQLGGAGRITALALDVTTIPGLTMSNWTVRVKHTSLTSYTSYLWESSDWTVAYQSDLTVTATGWVLFQFATPFDYDGTNSLMVDFSFNNSASSGSGGCRATSQGVTRTIYYYTQSGFGDPLTWSGSSPSPFTTSTSPNLLLLRSRESVPIQPLVTGLFTNGVWSGDIVALGAATNLVLEVNDGNGHTGQSGSFAVRLTDDIGITMTESANPVAVGAAFTYLITVTNTGPSAATGVLVTNHLPSEVALISVNPSQGTHTSDGQTVVCSLGTILGGNLATVAIEVQTSATGILTNGASVSRLETEIYTGNNVVTNLTSVIIPELAVNDSIVSEPSILPTNMVFAVTLSAASPYLVTVNYATTNGTALAGSDYTATNGILSFMPGQTNAQIAVEVLDDAASEPNETFWVVLSGPTNALLSDETGLGVIYDNDGPPEFRIVNLLATNSRVVDHNSLTGDDRGGVAISMSQAFVTGDSATARFNAIDLTAGTSLGIVRDSLCTDLRTETVYLLGNGSTPLTSSGGTVSSLIELNGATGLPNGVVLPLSQSFTMPSSGSGNGIFSGYGRIVVHNGSRVYDIYLPSGNVTDRGAMTRPAWYSSESWSVWGVAEYFDGALYVTYRSSSGHQIVRARVPDGATTVVSSFSNLGDMASFIVSPSRNRWYFHHEGSSQFGGSSETLGYADAQLVFVSTNPPVILSQPFSQTRGLGGAAGFSVTAFGSGQLHYQWRKDGTNLVEGGRISGVLTNQLSIANLETNDAGLYSVMITNLYGSVISSNAMLTVEVPLPPQVPFGPLPANYAVGISVHTTLSWNPSTNSAPLVPSALRSAIVSMNTRGEYLEAPSDATRTGASGSDSASGIGGFDHIRSVANVLTAEELGFQSALPLDAVVCGAASVDVWLADVATNLLATGLFNSVSTIQANLITPTLTEMQAFDVAIVFSDFGYANSTLLGNVMADYVDSGGGVVCMMFENGLGGSGDPNGQMQGRWNAEGYFAIPRSGQYQSAATLGTVHVPSHPIMQGVMNFSGGSSSYRTVTTSITSGSERVADWSDGRPLVVTKLVGDVRRVDLAFYPPSSNVRSDFWDVATDGALLMANALTWVAGDLSGPVFYDVYLGTNPTNLTLVSTGLPETTYDPGLLAFDTTYYWQIVASNVVGSVTGPVWQFTTAHDEIRFASATISVAEDSGMAIVNVLRDNPLGGTLSVQYAATNGTATAGMDYTPVFGSLQFDAGVMSTNFQVPILDDSAGEGVETVLLSLSLPPTNILISTSNAILSIVDNDSIQVSLFYDPTYVDTSIATSGEATNVVAALLTKGCQVQTFTGITPAAFSNALVGADILYIPELEIAELGLVLSPQAKSVISNFVSGGGGLIINGETGSRDENFVNQVFGRTIAQASSSSTTILTGVAAGTAFAGGPASLPQNNGTYEWLRSSLPLQALSIYQDAGGGSTTVAVIPQGLGKVVFLAYDWYDAVPRGVQDGGWDEVLRRALLEAVPQPSTTPPVILSQPANQLVLVGANAQFTVVSGGTLPLSYQWRKEMATLPNETNSTLSLFSVQMIDAGLYDVIVTNSYGMVTSSIATLTVTTNLPLVVGISAGGNNNEREALAGSLTNLGFSVRLVTQGQWTGLNVVVSSPGASSSSFGPNRAEISNGVPFVQISDYGSDWTPNVFTSIPEGTVVSLGVDTAHPITAGLAASWNSYGFWRYAVTGDYLGWSTDVALPSLVSETAPASQSRLLVADSLGVGRAVYIGWNVYGPDAGTNDLAVLRNAILWAAGQPTGQGPAITNQPQDQIVSVGDNATFTVMASGTPPLSYLWYKDTASLVGETNSTLSLVNVQTNDAGAYSVTVSNHFGAVTSSSALLTVVPLVSLAEALDTPGWTWLTGGQSDWRGQTTNSHDGVDAARTRDIGDSEETWMETTITNGPGLLTFWWTVSSQSGFDYLELYRNAVLQSNRISGEVSWQQVSMPVPGGNQVLRWRYFKDSSVSEGEDHAMVDQVDFAPMLFPPVIADGGHVNTNGEFSFVVNALAGSVVVIEASTNLVEWTPVHTNLVDELGYFLFRELQTGDYWQRFYRALLYQGALPSPGIQVELGGLRVDGVGGQLIVVEASTNLVFWAPVTTNRIDIGPLFVSDPVYGNFPLRFYRLKTD